MVPSSSADREGSSADTIGTEAAVSGSHSSLSNWQAPLRGLGLERQKWKDLEWSDSVLVLSFLDFKRVSNNTYNLNKKLLVFAYIEVTVSISSSEDLFVTPQQDQMKSTKA